MEIYLSSQSDALCTDVFVNSLVTFQQTSRLVSEGKMSFEIELKFEMVHLRKHAAVNPSAEQTLVTNSSWTQNQP